MLGFLPTRAYRPGTPGATTFLSPLSGTFNYGWDSFEEKVRKLERENTRLEKELQKAHLIIDVQGKVAGLLGLSLEDGTHS